jgi:alpha-glucosidase (family GH31 glycosyl hydrolase)
MFGPDLVVAPVLHSGARSRKVYLPGGSTWKNTWTDQTVPGGGQTNADDPLERIPLFLRGNAVPPIRAPDRPPSFEGHTHVSNSIDSTATKQAARQLLPRA